MNSRFVICILILGLSAGFVFVTPAPASGVLDALVGASSGVPSDPYERGTKTYGSGRMTPDLLKSCLILAHRIDGTNEKLLAKKSQIRGLDDRIQEAGPRLRNHAKQAIIDKENRADFAKQVEAYNKWVEQRLAVVRSHNRQVQEFFEMSRRFDGECNGRAYFPSDLDVIAPDLPPEIRMRLK